LYIKKKQAKIKSAKKKFKISYFEPVPMPEASSDPIYLSFSKKEALLMLFKFYQRTSNSKVNRYVLTKRFIVKNNIKQISKRKERYFKRYDKRTTFSWAGESFKPHVWKIKHMYPVQYKKVYYQIQRLEETYYIDKPESEHYKISIDLDKKRRIYRNTLKVARNLGKMLSLRKAYLNYMFSVNWAKPEVDNEYLFIYDDINWYGNNYLGFFLKNNKTKNPNYSLWQSFDKKKFLILINKSFIEINVC